MSNDRKSTPVVLDVKDLTVAYGAITAVKGLNLQVRQGEIVTLIGSNGAGKSTTLRTVSGLLKPKSGTITYKDEVISGVPGHEIVKKGICQSPEGRRIFQRMTVDENLELGAFLRKDVNEYKQTREEVLDLFPRLRERLTQKAGTMSGGEQQMLAVARALMGHPDLLILDEPSMGLAPVLVDLIFETIEKINKERGITILLVEQNALAALRVGDYAYVLESGSLKLEGNAKQLATDPAVIEAYLGGH